MSNIYNNIHTHSFRSLKHNLSWKHFVTSFFTANFNWYARSLFTQHETKLACVPTVLWDYILAGFHFIKWVTHDNSDFRFTSFLMGAPPMCFSQLNVKHTPAFRLGYCIYLLHFTLSFFPFMCLGSVSKGFCPWKKPTFPYWRNDSLPNFYHLLTKPISALFCCTHHKQRTSQKKAIFGKL